MNKAMPSNEMIADHMARKVFARRGNRSEAHLGELELAAIINAALETRDELAKQLDKLKEQKEFVAMLAGKNGGAL
jgi:ATP-dependent helicase/DNAse subunit B